MFYSIPHQRSPVKAMSRALVASRILVQILLVIFLRIPPRARSYNLSDNLLACWKRCVNKRSKHGMRIANMDDGGRISGKCYADEATTYR